MHVTLVGLGNIGSHAAEFLARNPSVTALTLIDHDMYEKTNASSQAIYASDLGKAKATAQARRLQKLRPAIRIDAICDRVENLPLGRLQCDVLAAAVDTRITRQYLNEVCWSLGIPWVDSGVNPESGLARINAYEPAFGNPCIECDWGDRHYETLEVEYPCGSSDRPAAHTNSPASLGGLAGALLAIECEKLLNQEKAQSVIGRQLIYDARWHKHHVVELQRNPGCRFSHKTLPVSSAGIVSASTPLSEIFGRTGLTGAGLRVACSPGFVMHAVCPACGSSHRNLWKVAGGLRCTRCRHPVIAAGFETVHELRELQLPEHVLRRPLSNLGLLAGDLLVLSNAEAEECLQIGEGHA